MNKLTGFTIGILVVALVLGIFSVRIVDDSKTCAIVRLGDVVGKTQTGVNFVVPFVSGIDCYSAQVTTYQTGASENKEADYWDYPVEIKTSDGQSAQVSFNVTYHVEDANVMRIRDEVASSNKILKERVVANYARSLPRNISPSYTAEELYTTGRTGFENDIRNALRTKFAEYGVTLDDFSLRDINFSDAYEKAIEDKQIAKEQIEVEKNKAEAAKNIAAAEIEKSKGEAGATVERAKAEAQSTILQAEAEAKALELKGQALENNPKILTLEFINALNTSKWMMVPWDKMEPFLPLQDANTP